MKNQNFEVLCKVLSETELQETIGGGVASWLTSCFTSSNSNPTVKVPLPGGTTVKVHQSTIAHYVRILPRQP